ncbi:MAG TPA: serine/threonine-protein kinase [Polyangiaceae bacterium]|jgi:serine/threonine-protein kinase|nr:serine/threonine-protein kinase [Polyangiaceae bacterium]
MSLVGRTLAKRYKILSLLGKGGMGAVYEAEQIDLQRRVAVKVLTHEADTNGLLRFKQEALAAAGLAHPNIVQVFDFVAGDEPILVMEMLRGKSLGSLVKEEGKLAPARAVSMMTQVLSALGAAHDARIVHRDVKPENIFVCASALPYELVKVLDFGLARPLDAEKQLVRTRVGVAMGTPAYMAPEQARGASADVRMDVFAAGVTLYYALAGRRPFDGKTVSEILAAVKKQPPIPLDAICPELDFDLVRVVERALSKDPDARFATAKAFLEALVPHWPKPAREEIRASKDEVPAQPPSVRAPKSSKSTGGVRKKRAAFVIDDFERMSPPIAVGMVATARFAHDGESAFAAGRTGLARWNTGAGFSARELPPGFPPKTIRGITFGPSGEALVFAEGAALMRVSGAFARLDVPEKFAIAAAHVDHASHVSFAGSRDDEAVLVESSPAGVVPFVIGRGSMLGVTRTTSGALVACGTRGTLCASQSGKLHAHVASRETLRAITPLGQGFIAVGEHGAVVHGDDITTAREDKLGDEDLCIVRTRARYLCVASGSTLYVTTIEDLARPAIAMVAGTIRDVWLGNGIVRVLLDTAEVLEAVVTAAP